MNLKIKYILYILLLVNAVPLFSQLKLNVQYRPNQIYYNAESDAYPTIYADIKPELDGNSIKLNKENLVVIEKKRELSDYHLTARIDSLKENSDGSLRIWWQSKSEGYNKPILVGSYNGEAASEEVVFAVTPSPLIIIKDAVTSQNVDRVDFGVFKPGQLNYKQIYIVAFKGIFSGGVESGFRIDSVAFDSPYFSLLWQGNAFERTPPPFKTTLASEYLVDLYYNAPDNEFRNATFTVYYHGGYTKKLFITAGYTSIERDKTLEVIQPVAGDHFAPCQETLIKWKGHVPNLPSIVEVSFDNGKKWNYITTVVDSQYVWTVPDSVSSQTLIRVYQKYTETTVKDITTEGPYVSTLAYNSTGSQLASAVIDGKIKVWDLTTYANTSVFNALARTPALFKGMAYLEGDTKFAALYQSLTGSSRDTIVVFNTSNGAIISKNVFDLFIVKKFKTDSKKKYILVTPSFGGQLALLNASDFSVAKTMTFDLPIVGADFDDKNDKLVVSLMDGTIKLYSLNDFSLLNSLDFNHLPLNLEMSASPNGKLLAIGVKTDGTGTFANHAIVNLEKGIVIKYVSPSASDPVGLRFSPSSAILAVGSEAQPQIAFMDLTLDQIIATMSGGNGLLTDLQFNPQGSSIATASSNGKIYYRTFTYPEMDTTDGFIIIEKAKPVVEQLVMDNQYIGTSYYKTFPQAVCNNDIVPLKVFDIRFKNQRAFTLDTEIKEYVLQPNSCLSLNIGFHPLDTGAIYDTLIVTACGVNFIIPVKGYSLNRNIRLSQNEYNFGEVCIGENKTIKLQFDNLDPEILELDRFEPSDPTFKVNLAFGTIKVDAKGSFEADISFSPDTLGEIKGNIILYHSGQKNVFFTIPVRGIGIGSFLAVSHKDLYFIPEILEREVEIINTGDKAVTLIQPIFSKDSLFEVITPMPLLIEARKSVMVKVRWSAKPTAPVALKFIAEPCVTNSDLALGVYTGSSKLDIPELTVKSTDEAEIPILFENTENRSYAGVRFFETTISVNPRLFMPLSVSSEFGSGSIVSNEIVNGRRHFTIRVDGDFPASGKAAVIKGIPGLAETDTTHINFIKSTYWGQAVQVQTNDGLLRVNNGSPTRRVLKNNSMFQIVSINPNPASQVVTVQFEASADMEYTAKVVDMYGRAVLETAVMKCIAGNNQVTLNLNFLAPGSYSVIISGSGAANACPLIIVR